MSVLVAGTIAIDNVKTPSESRENLLGGSAAFAAVSASFFSPVNLLGIVGNDFPDEHMELLRARGINTEGVEVSEDKTFSWTGEYHDDMNTRDTLDVALNCIENFEPTLNDAYRDSKVIILANMAPEVQIHVLDQLTNPTLVVADSMDLWINIAREKLTELLKRVDLFVINDSEAQLFTDTNNLIAAGHKLREMGPKYVVVKKGEHGAMLFGDGKFFTTGAYPLHEVVDPTGAGDSFAGGLAGYLASLGKDEVTFEDIAASLVYGTVMASYNCESFSMEKLAALSQGDIASRFDEFRGFTAF